MNRALRCVLFGLMIALGTVSGPALAVEGNPEQTVWVAADHARQIVEGILSGRSDPADEKALQGLHEIISSGHLLLTERLRLRGETLQRGDVLAGERHRAATGRYEAAVSRVLAGFTRVAAFPEVAANALEELHAALVDLAPPRQPAIHGILPYHQPLFPLSPPVATPQVTPAYRRAELAPASAADLAGTPEAPVSAQITAQAKAIAAASGRSHWDPAAIYNWVRENIRTEWYWGSMKGAEETLRQKSGNDADQAALLIALLRASGYPARYVRGVAEFFPGLEAARSATGISDPEQILTFFQRAGIPCEAVHEGGRLVNLRFEHLWVEALVPYANYRGMEADATGKLWAPLDTSLKTGGFDETAAIDLSSLPDHPLAGFRDRYLATVHQQTPLELLRHETELFLAAAQPGRTFADVLHTRRQRQAPLGILPATLQFIDVAVTAEYTALPLELQHQVRLQATADDPARTTLFDLTVPLRELSNRQTMIGFEPETVEDQEQINRWGGLDNTPAYLVRLRPTLVVAGERRAVAASGLVAGDEFSLSVEFSGPPGRFSVNDRILAGYPLLLGIVAQEALPPGRETLPDTAPEQLHRAALAYAGAWNNSERELAELFDLALARPLPSFVAVGGMLRVDRLAGLPHAVHWQGLFIDANLRAAAAVPRTGADTESVRGFFELSALEGSAQEHRLFEEEFGIAAISTAKLIGLAQSSGSMLVTLDEANVAELLPSLESNDQVNVDIVDAVSRGWVVHIPADEIQQSAWSGIGYIKENPVTGEAGYMLSGGLAGGQTVLGRRDWPVELAAIMARPFTGEPTADPAEAFSLAAVTPWSIREATAGEPLNGNLMALVRDARGNAVVGAPVTFTVRTGGGWVIDELLQPGEQKQQLTVASGRDGIARARFVPGEHTTVNPVAYVRPGDRHANLVGENLIDVKLASGSLVSLSAPMAIFGFAGLPDPELSRAYGSNLSGEVFSYSGDTLLLLKDRFGNPVANQTVTFVTGPVEPVAGSNCQSPPGLAAERRLAQLVGDSACLQDLPSYGECSAAAQVAVDSRTDGGARAGVILGGVPHARYPVAATFATNSGASNADWFHQSIAFASCLGAVAPPENRLILNYQKRLDAAGRNVDARPSGTPAEVRVRARMLAERETVVSGGQTLSCSPAPNLTCNMVAGTGSFTLESPAQVDINGKPAMRVATMSNSLVLPGLYRADISLAPGLGSVFVNLSSTRIMQRIVNDCSGCGPYESNALVTIEPERYTLSIWGVELQVPEVAAILVDVQGLAQHDLRFEFTVLPADYVANFAQVLLYRNGELWDTLPAGTSGTPAVVFPAGYWFDPKASYDLQVLLNNPGDANEIRSRKIPLLRRTAAVDLQIDGLSSAVEDQVGAFVLLNNDFDEKDADPTVTLPDAATAGLVEGDDELKRAWLQIDDSTGQGGSWQVRAGDPAKLRIYHRKDGAWVEFKHDDPPEPVASFPAIIPLYLEGLVESAAIRGDTLTATFFPAGGAAVADAVPLSMIHLDMAVDGNRDRTIDFQVSPDEKALFWVNNDRDYLHEEDGQPVEDDAETGDDSIDAKISCKRDLEDLSRLHILLGRLGISGQLTFTMSVAADDEKNQPMLNIFPAVNRSDGYLGLPSDEATPEQPAEQVQKRLVAAVAKLPVTLPASTLIVIGGNPFVYEGRMPGKGRLVLTAHSQGVPVASRSVALELVDPSWFYDHFVVSQADEKLDGSVNPFVNPEGMAANASRLGLYRPGSDEYVLFVHGWNMQPWEKRRWAETVFKRLWWQGYKGKVGLFDWPCRTLPFWDFLVNYDRSEFNAWQSASALSEVLSRLQGEHAAQIRLLAHSQGNVVASEALRQGTGGQVYTYVASQAALSASYYSREAFSPELSPITLKTPEVFARYPDTTAGTPYLESVRGKVGTLYNYSNPADYALTGNNIEQPTWEFNNLTRPDNSLGYSYRGSVDTYPPSSPDLGFFQSIVDGDPDDGSGDVRTMQFPQNTYEIYSFCAQSRTRALGAVSNPPQQFSGAANLIEFGYDGHRYSHSRQFRSSFVDELAYWSRFVADMGVSRTWE